MAERRALERLETNQLALLHVDGIRGCHPCLVMDYHTGGAMLHSLTHHTAAFRFDLSLDGFKTTWSGVTRIGAVSNLSINE